MLRRTAILALLGVLPAWPACAAPITWFAEDLGVVDGTPASTPNSRAARSAFDAYFGGAVLSEDFEPYAPGGALPPVAPFSLPTASFVDGLGRLVLARFDQAGAVTPSALATSGGQTYGDDEDWLFVASFSPPGGPIGLTAVNGFGLFGIAVDAPVTFSVLWSDGAVEAFAPPITPSPRAIFFWGVADPARTVVLVTAAMPLNIGSGFYLMDDLVIGLIPVETPAPPALALFGLGGLALAARRRARR